MERDRDGRKKQVQNGIGTQRVRGPIHLFIFIQLSQSLVMSLIVCIEGITIRVCR